MKEVVKLKYFNFLKHFIQLEKFCWEEEFFMITKFTF